MTEQSRSPAPGATSGECATPGRIRVFLLDDHELIRRGLRDLLDGTDDIEVVGESGTAHEGARRILALRPDVALLDVQLPDRSGVEVCRWVLNRDPTIRALMLTTFDDEEARMAAILAGASGFVLKQIRGTDLTDAIRRVFSGQSIPAPAPEDRAQLTGPDADPRMASLTGQERRVLSLIVEGLTNSQIGDRLGIGEKTVRNHVTNLLAKLGLSRRTQAAVYAVTHDAAPRTGGTGSAR